MTEELDKLSTEELGNLFPVKISEYDPDWKKMFISEKQIIQKAIGMIHIIRIEHIGSTAIKGLCAKPTIDILVEIKDNINTDLLIDNLNQTGYHFIPRPENPPPHMMFVKGYTLKGYIGQAFHVHIRYKGDWDEIIFRNFLINHPQEAQKYSELKFRLASEYFSDREAYTDGKTEYITGIIKIARQELNNQKKTQVY
jgi:GrpB-like predicted nucleotidyltransferase (UPF0157 family)